MSAPHCPVCGQEDGEKWQDDRGQDAVEVHLVRRERDPED